MEYPRTLHIQHRIAGWCLLDEQMTMYLRRRRNENRRRNTMRAQLACQRVGLPEAEFWANIRDLCNWLPGLVRSMEE